MSFAEQLRSIYISEQPSANTTYDTNIIFAGVYGATVRECKRQAIGAISLPPTPTITSNRGQWLGTNSYIPGDGVTYIGAVYVCINGNVNQQPPNPLYWVVVPPVNIVWKGAWNALSVYNYGDGTIDAGVSYVCILQHTGQQPPNATYWAVYTQPARSFTLDITSTTAAVAAVTALPRPEQGGGVVVWRGVWNNYTEYVLNDAVTYQGASYVCSVPNINLPPFPPNAYWYSPAPGDPIYQYVPQTGTYVATSADLVLIRDRLIKKLTTADMGLTVVLSGPINITISW
jgi:hypothetical protein